MLPRIDWSWKGIYIWDPSYIVPDILFLKSIGRSLVGLNATQVCSKMSLHKTSRKTLKYIYDPAKSRTSLSMIWVFKSGLGNSVDLGRNYYSRNPYQGRWKTTGSRFQKILLKRYIIQVSWFWIEEPHKCGL